MVVDIIVGIVGGVVLAAFATAPIAVALEILKSKNRDTPTEAKYFFGGKKSFRFFQEKPAVIQDKEAFLVTEKQLQFAANFADNADASVLSKRQGSAPKSVEDSASKAAGAVSASKPMEDSAKKVADAATKAMDEEKKALEEGTKKAADAKSTPDEVVKAVKSEGETASNEGKSDDETFVSEGTTSSKEEQKEDGEKKVLVFTESPTGR